MGCQVEPGRNAIIRGLFEVNMFQRFGAVSKPTLETLLTLHGDDGEAEDDEDTEQGQASEHEEPGWVMGTITNTI